MSKYQKLDNALLSNAHDDDSEGGFPVCFDDNHQNTGFQRDPDTRDDRLLDNQDRYYSVNNNEVDREVVTIGSNVVRVPEEQTWEVPLLGDCGDNARNQSSEAEFDMQRDCCNHQPGFRANPMSKSAQEAKYKIMLAVFLCCIFMIIEFLGGYVAGSLAIMTDAAHLASDCISFVIGLVAIWIGSRPPDERMSFGYKRFEVIGALASILGIWFVTTLLVVVAVQRIYSQDFELNADMMMLISGIGIFINIVMMFVLHGSWFVSRNGHGHSHSHNHENEHEPNNSPSQTRSNSYIYTASGGQNPSKVDERHSVRKERNLTEHKILITNGKKTNQAGTSKIQLAHEEKNLNLRAAMIHVIGDLVQSIGVFLASVLIKVCPGAKYADPLCTLIFSIIVIMTTLRLFRESMGIIVNAVPQNLNMRTLHLELGSLQGVRSVHHLNVWQQTSQQRVLMVHLVIDSRADCNEVLQTATELVAGPKYNVKHATIQIEPTTE
ncbi:zinc transporter 2-like [Drosophila yakuba]|uniref:Uncharacterized protein n=2 Tax=Drosophila yakuba TaxID=7245 RepID=B4NYX5_DROYA|nr:zinc transporter 2-like [Drosophila yakuba]XP_039226381.1 zinc transporter 2-like [Drosophila yakuba]XP_039226382.1 zinc transporter 2-like [Drosophila yakuba]XP_039226383.1 zinc transporter 2-like [Drosophila yakuba]EDW89826.1 uncharacterized protein Dyak_GE19441 [Drosophila yakuba]